MRELGFKKCFVWLVAVIAIGICSFIVVREKESVQRDRDVDRSCLMMPDKVAIGTDRQRYVPPTEAEMREYEHIVEEIVAAYSNRQANLMLECVNHFPPSFYRLRGRDYSKVIRPIDSVWFESWHEQDPEVTSLDSNGVDELLHANLALTKVLGGIMVKSKASDDDLCLLDPRFLELLQSYRDRFRKAGKTECFEVVERYIAEWIEHIESENGFTRAYARKTAKIGQHWIRLGELTPKDIRNQERGSVHELQKRCGYTPKWLDEEFPVLEEKAGKMKE